MTCERISGVFLYWNVSIPHLSVSSESIVANEGNISIGSLQLNGLQSIAFSITRISGNPLISELLVNNVTTEMNGSTIYCSENGNETGAPLATVNVTNKGALANMFYYRLRSIV